MSKQSASWITLRSTELCAEINPLGAELSILRDLNGHDLLWNGDPSVWSGRSPILFPIVGELLDGTFRLGEERFHLARHGFARGKLFTVTEKDERSVTFTLNADSETVRVYPFRFQLSVNFALQGSTLIVTTHVRNLGTADMPASIGYHPAFRWPLPFGQPRSSHFIEFACEESAPIRRLSSQGLLTPEPQPTPVVGRKLALADSLFQDDVIIFDNLRSRSLVFGAAEGPGIRMLFPDALYLGIWSKTNAQFVCIEPWHGIADPEGFSQDFTKKPGVAMIPVGGELSLTMEITSSA